MRKTLNRELMEWRSITLKFLLKAKISNKEE